MNPVHYVAYASQPYVTIFCNDWEGYVVVGKFADGVGVAEVSKLRTQYTFEREFVTCEECLAKLERTPL